jgi:hypothetical protein
MRFPHGPGMNGFAIVSQVAEGLVVVLCIAVIVGLLVLIVRFLLVATKAAQLYIARNSAVTAPAPVAEPPAEATIVSPATARSRTPKTPPAV